MNRARWVAGHCLRLCRAIGGAAAGLRRRAARRALARTAARPVVSRRAAPLSPRRLLAPADLARVFAPLLAELAQERLYAVLLDRTYRPLGVHLVYQGSAGGIDVSLHDCFREAVRLGAAGIVLVHNHPAGDVGASAADLALTADAICAGDLLGIRLLDHLIIGGGESGYSSIADWGAGWEPAANMIGAAGPWPPRGAMPAA